MRKSRVTKASDKSAVNKLFAFLSWWGSLSKVFFSFWQEHPAKPLRLGLLPSHLALLGLLPGHLALLGLGPGHAAWPCSILLEKLVSYGIQLLGIVLMPFSLAVQLFLLFL